jgi:hypothetical protein
MRSIDFCHAMPSFEIVRPDAYWLSLSETWFHPTRSPVRIQSKQPQNVAP